MLAAATHFSRLSAARPVKGTFRSPQPYSSPIPNVSTMSVMTVRGTPSRL
jgi:hypothetical protein